MNIQRYHRDHEKITQQINALRSLVKSGVCENAEKISEGIVDMASHIKFHLHAEDQVLYPALARCGNTHVVAMSASFQKEMQGLVKVFSDFVLQWRIPSRLLEDPEGFRRDANVVMRALFERLQRENKELYPAAESI